jgi:stearoyl-CoA desaturase (delta-9 desaturase)
MFTIAGLFSLVGGPLFYVLVHRYHHIHSDNELDPHSPHHGKFHAFIGWVFKAHTLTIPIKLVKDLLVEKNKWLLQIDIYKIYIVYTVVICAYVLSTSILIGLLLAMFTAFFIELYINAFLHDPEIKISKNSNRVMCRITFGGMEHKLHHAGSAKTDPADPAYPLVNLLSKFS